MAIKHVSEQCYKLASRSHYCLLKNLYGVFFHEQSCPWLPQYMLIVKLLLCYLFSAFFRVATFLFLNQFSGAGRPVSRIWKWCFQVRVTPSPTLGNTFPGAGVLPTLRKSLFLKAIVRSGFHVRT